ncbi:MAG: prepilin-type N-terminal cleavage/methylation domain-containing protein [Candidatus Marinimicrobia bacterium]|nr:prepilin-type N-terminal cleavage/methylation domain-containing protein [Candidatus Neomarinimicrobiota bacterium]
MNTSRSRGTTLPEIMIAMVIASIVAIGYASTLMYTQNMYNDTVIRSQISQDTYIIDQYIRKKLTLQIADSLSIYADSTAEKAGTTSSSGTILRSVRPGSTVDHVEVISNKLVWGVDSLLHYPIDSEVSSILFTRRNGYSKTILDISLQLSEGTDNLSLDWMISIRN